uniref:Calcineurin-like phosphoesterase domain-containing protein n=1 Tax=candidate division WOR-3 bacterium TaxID=2052148 RepID=A0A7V3ZWD3_UNCW3
MKKIIFFIFILPIYLFSLTFVVLGRVSEEKASENFKQIIEEISILRPGFIIQLGDLIESIKGDSLKIIKEWEKTLRILKKVNTKIYFVPGENEISSETSEKIYLSLIGKPYYSFSYDNAHFVILNISRERSLEELPPAMIDWLEKDLAAHKKYKWKFIFFHRPLWRYEYEKKKLKDFYLHQIFKRYKINYVFSGHEQFSAYLFYDSIHYFQVGSAINKNNEFSSYLFIKINKEEVNVCLIKPGAIFSKEKILLEKLISLKRFKKEGIKLSSLLLTEEKETDTIFLYLSNPFLSKIKGKFFWKYSPNYSFDSDKGNFLLESKGTGRYQFLVKIKSPYEIYPLPKLHLHFDCNGEKDSLVFILPIKKEIKLKKGEYYPLENFAKEDGNKADLEAKIFISYDQENFYLNLENRNSFDSLALYFAKTPDSLIEIVATKDKRLIFYQIRQSAEGIKRVQKKEKKWQEEIKIPLKEILFINTTYFNIKFYQKEETYYLKVPFEFDTKDWYQIHFDI